MSAVWQSPFNTTGGFVPLEEGPRRRGLIHSFELVFVGPLSLSLFNGRDVAALFRKLHGTASVEERVEEKVPVPSASAFPCFYFCCGRGTERAARARDRRGPPKPLFSRGVAKCGCLQGSDALRFFDPIPRRRSVSRGGHSSYTVLCANNARPQVSCMRTVQSRCNREKRGGAQNYGVVV